MKILFLFPSVRPYDSVTVREIPSGGTDKAVIFLGEAFRKLGHEVSWVTDWQSVPSSPALEPDVVIAQHAVLFQSFPNSRKVWWVHLFSEQPLVQQHAEAAKTMASQVVSLSRAHYMDLKKSYQLESLIIGHGVWLEELETEVERDPHRLIYCSVPDRGLEYVPTLFKALKAKVPKANITICSSMKLYGKPEEDQYYEDIFAELRLMEGVSLKGALNQQELYREMAAARFFFYPCTVRETYCMVMDEAIAHGCWPLLMEINCKGALSERAGVCWGEDLLDVYEASIQNQTAMLPFDNPRSWLEVAKQWDELILKESL